MSNAPLQSIAMSNCQMSTKSLESTMSSVSSSVNYRLVWRQRKLIVKQTSEQETIPLSALEHFDSLVDCLSRSPVEMVLLDPTLGDDQLKFWANACQKAGKSAYLRLRSNPQAPHKQRPLYWQTKRILDWAVACLMLILLGPVMLFLAGFMAFSTPGPIFFQQWRVGERGKLFKIIKFRTMVVGAEQLHHQLMSNQTGLHKLQNDPRVTPMGTWMRKYSLDELPQLFNVLRGEMSLVGPRPWALYDAVRITPNLKHRLNALPGITGAWQVQSRSLVTDLNAVNHCDLTYLNSWSLSTDLKFLLMTIPKVITGFGAF